MAITKGEDKLTPDEALKILVFWGSNFDLEYFQSSNAINDIERAEQVLVDFLSETGIDYDPEV
jgi:hypothetical protein